jgi:hypothetical protein
MLVLLWCCNYTHNCLRFPIELNSAAGKVPVKALPASVLQRHQQQQQQQQQVAGATGVSTLLVQEMGSACTLVYMLLLLQPLLLHYRCLSGRKLCAHPCNNAAAAAAALQLPGSAGMVSMHDSS